MFRYRPQQLSQLLHQLSSMLRAGLPLLESLSVLQKANYGSWNKMIIAARTEVGRGRSFSDALLAFQAHTGPLTPALLQAGERMGNLDEMADRAAELIEANVRLQHNIANQLAYPIFLIVVSILLGPLYMLFTDNSNGYFVTIAPGLLAVAGMIALWQLFMRSHSGGKVRDELMISLPVIGRITGVQAIVRLSQTLAAAYHAGIPIDDAVELAGLAAGNTIIKGKFHGGYKKHRLTQHAISQALHSVPHASDMVIQMVHTGEETGKLDEMLGHASRIMEEENGHRIQRSVRLLGVGAFLLVALWIGLRVIVFYRDYYSLLAN